MRSDTSEDVALCASSNGEELVGRGVSDMRLVFSVSDEFGTDVSDSRKKRRRSEGRVPDRSPAQSVPAPHGTLLDT